MGTYVVSDIHGLYDKFKKACEALDLVNGTDHLYILGDVIDRGKEGIRILEEIMENPHVTLIMGNHEHMMVEYLSYAEEHYGYFKDICACNRIKAVERWNRNGNVPTLHAFYQLSDERQKQLYLYLRELPLAITNLTVKEQRYYLVHACPLPNRQEEVLYLSNCEEVEAVHLVWERYEETTDFFEDRCVIHGHTPTLYLQKGKPYRIWANRKDLMQAGIIDIDCGCALGSESGRLALFCLDDRSVRYI